MNLITLWLSLAILSGVILFTSHFLAKSADLIAEKTNIGRSFVGVILLATATSLPELGTGISSIMLIGQPDLAAGDAFGSNLFNLLIIGVLDTSWRNTPILGVMTKSSLYAAFAGIILILVACLAIFIHGSFGLSLHWPVSPISLMLVTLFVASMYAIYCRDRIDIQDINPSAVVVEYYKEKTLSSGVLMYAVSASIMVLTSLMLARTGDSLAEALNWDVSFVGTQFLALSTSLPELATSISAMRLGSPELAVSNLLGSNMFNMGFVLFVDELAYFEGVFWSSISTVHMITCAFAILMTLLVIIAANRADSSYSSNRIRFLGPVLLLVYIAASVSIFVVAQV